MMTVLSEYRKQSTKNPKLCRTTLVIKCDECSVVVEKSVNVKKEKKKTYHFCSTKCFFNASKKGGKIDVKKRETNKKLHGIDYLFMRHDIASTSGQRAWFDDARLKRKETLNERYGVDYAFDIPHVRDASNKTFTSKPELMLLEILVERFGIDDVVHHPRIFKRTLDFYIKSIDIYVEMDGEYWHCLDEDINVVEKSKRKNDVCRTKKFYRDKETNNLFEQHGLRLVRITDRQMKEMTSEDIISFITDKI